MECFAFESAVLSIFLCCLSVHHWNRAALDKASDGVTWGAFCGRSFSNKWAHAPPGRRDLPPGPALAPGKGRLPFLGSGPPFSRRSLLC